jgi:allantoinase
MAAEPPFRYWPEPARPALEWPDGARMAVWIAVNLEHYPIDKPGLSIVPPTVGLVPDPANYGWRDYGVRVGIWRLIDVLDAHGIPVSAPIHSAVCERYPQIVEAGTERDWAWIAHGRDNSVFETDMSPDEERDYLAEVVEATAAGTGSSPKGWLGPALTETFATPRLLAELGLSYVLDWCNDDQPYPLDVEGMISLPYSIEANDIPLLITKGYDGQAFERTLVDQFDGLYELETPTVMSIALHPFLVGQPFRLSYLDRALAHMRQRSDVWWATSDEIADWYLEHLYEAAVAALDPASSDRARA